MAFLNPEAVLASKLFHKNVIKPKIASQGSNSASQVAATAHVQNVASVAGSRALSTHKVSKMSIGTAKSTTTSNRYQIPHPPQFEVPVKSNFQPLPKKSNDKTGETTKGFIPLTPS